MTIELKVPEMGESVIEASVSRWLKQVGDEVTPGEALVALETDKITLEVSAQQAGKLARIDHPAGDTVRVGEVLALIEDGQAMPQPPAVPPTTQAQSAQAAQPSAQPVQSTRQTELDKPLEGVLREEGVPPGNPPTPQAAAEVEQKAVTSGESLFLGDAPLTETSVTPVAKRLADEKGVDLHQVTPARGERITRQDVETWLLKHPAQAAQSDELPEIPATPPEGGLGSAISGRNTSSELDPDSRNAEEEEDLPSSQPLSADAPAHVILRSMNQAQAAAAPAVSPSTEVAMRKEGVAPTVPASPIPSTPADATPQPSPLAMRSPADPRGEQRIRISRRRQTIARRLVEAQHTAAMLTTFNEIDLSAVMDLRKRRREWMKEHFSVDLGFMSFFVRASVSALKAFPRVNAEIQGEEFVLKQYYDIGIAVGAEEGLVVPVLRSADQMSFAQIEKAIRQFSEKAKNLSLTLEDLRGGTFTITNGGVFGSLLSTPILNPPQVAILGMHRIQDRAVVVKGEIVIRPMMYVALSYDHRIVDGREAVQFLVRIKELLEDPESLLLS